MGRQGGEGLAKNGHLAEKTTIRRKFSLHRDLRI
jgi:hypothetical protein